jgi:uncharacterized protein (TIGR01777 family)
VRVFVTGATGLIGRALCRTLLASGHEVMALSRAAAPRTLPPGARVVRGDPAEAGAWQDVLAACDGCVHLAGEPVATGRWTEDRKRRIRDSRVESTRRVAEVIAARGPTVLVSGSAIGWYGPRGEDSLDETSSPGADFMARVCRDWEEAALPAAARARVVTVRTGIVLARDGGALPRMLLPFRLFAGGPIGDGMFWQSWIHLADEVAMVAWALEHAAVEGPLVVTAPAPVRNRDLARAIGRALHRPALVPVPVAALRLAMGELADVVASGQRALPRKALELGFRFRFPEIEAALEDLLRR